MAILCIAHQISREPEIIKIKNLLPSGNSKHLTSTYD